MSRLLEAGVGTAILNPAERAREANKLYLLAQGIFEWAGDGVFSIFVGTDGKRLVLEKGIDERYSDTRAPIKEVFYDLKRHDSLSLLSIREFLVVGPDGEVIDTDQDFRGIEDQLSAFLSAINNSTAGVAKIATSQ